jgi:hypothetical protein
MTATRLLIACLVPMLLAACASEGFQVSAHTQSVAYRNHVDPALILRASPPSCATLPPLAPTTNGGLAPLADLTFLMSLRSVAPAGTVLPSAESTARLNQQGLAGDWQALARDYATCGMLDRERLARIGKALGVRHLILPMVGYVVTNDTQQVSPFNITVAVTVSAAVYASIQVWDAEHGAIEWTSTANCAIAMEVAAAGAYPLHQALRTCWDQMLVDLIENRRGSLLRVKTAPPSTPETLNATTPDQAQALPPAAGTR